jgi:hypothetical protein
MNDFFNQKNVSIDMDEFRRRLDHAVRELRELDVEPDYDYAPMVQSLVKWLEGEFTGHPPLAFIEALRTYYTAKKQELVTDELPTLLHEAGLESATTSDGTKISLKREVSIAQGNRDALYAWLKENGYGDFVKTVLAFGKGEFDDGLRAVLAETGASYEEKEDVHYQTLAKIFRDRVEEGGALPPEQVAKITIFDRARYSK